MDLAVICLGWGINYDYQRMEELYLPTLQEASMGLILITGDTSGT